MALMEDLPNEICAAVLNLLYHSSPKTMQSLALVNKSFNALVRHRNFQTYTFRGENVRSDLARIDRGDMWHVVRRVSIPEHLANRAVFCGVLAKMMGLTDIDLECHTLHMTLRGTLITTLLLRPQIRLHVGVDVESIEPGQLLYLRHFQDSPNLYSLDLKQEWDDDRVTRILMKILFTCPNLHHLKLKTRPEQWEDVLGIDGIRAFFGSKRLPPLETLEVTSRDIDMDLTTFPGHLMSPLPQDQEKYHWMKNLDLSQLKRLRIYDMSLPSRVIEKFTCLKEVDFTGHLTSSLTIKFLRQVPTTLESIKIHSLHVSDLDAILRHGRELGILHIIGPVYREGGWRTDRSIEAVTLQQIQNGCPKIEELALHCTHDNTWADDVLCILAGFRRLSSLKLTYYQQLHGLPLITHSPFVTFSRISELFKSIRVRFPGEPSPLRKLCVVPILSGFEHFVHVESMTHSLICELSERDEDAVRGVFTVTCPDIKEKDNLILQKALETGEDPISLLEKPEEGIRLKKVSGDFKFAWYGPEKPHSTTYNTVYEYRSGALKFFNDGDSDEDWVVENDEDYREFQRASSHLWMPVELGMLGILIN
ncbi:hypothetical protein F5Y13DRAFT_205998 [Hypoxylon sp. FL1857]|nr:hypothetical protein F5Y13DRAFT_205998 [Hypoxylon sp. FL1857]